MHRVDATLEQTVGVGDAENDLAFLSICGLAVAVANALDHVKASVDWITEGPRGAGVVELLARWRTGELDTLAAAVRQRQAGKGADAAGGHSRSPT